MYYCNQNELTSCPKHKIKLHERLATLEIRRDNQKSFYIGLKTGYCNKCDKYLINRIIYTQLKKKLDYTSINCILPLSYETIKISIKNEKNSNRGMKKPLDNTYNKHDIVNKTAYLNRRKQSELYSIGYSTKDETLNRHKAIGIAIRNYDKNVILNNLYRNITEYQKNERFTKALPIWRADVEWIEKTFK